MKSVVFHPDAEAEATAASEYYDSRNPGLGEEFENAVQAAVAQIARMPTAFPSHGNRGMRKSSMRRFPYTIYFLE